MTSGSRWRPGDQIVMRSVWSKRVVAAWPVTVVEDSPERLVIYLAAGAKYKLRTFDSSAKARLPVGDWTLADDLWRVDLIRIMPAGDGHAYLAFWSDDGSFSRWYINLERHYERTKIVFDFVDHFLDIVIAKDLRSWSWKDEDELAEAVSSGVILSQQADEVRAEGHRAIARLEAHASPFNDGWERWKPNLNWAIPELPPVTLALTL